jgi:hypothetical protein
VAEPSGTILSWNTGVPSVQKIARPSRKAQHYMCQDILLLQLRCSRTIRLQFGTLMLLNTHIVLTNTSQIENKSTKARVSAGKSGSA